MQQKLLTFLNQAWAVQVLGGLALAGILALIPRLRTLGINRIRKALAWLSIRHSYPRWALVLGPFAYLARKPLAMPRLEPTPFKHLSEGILWRGILTPDLQATALKAFCPECDYEMDPEFVVSDEPDDALSTYFRCRLCRETEHHFQEGPDLVLEIVRKQLEAVMRTAHHQVAEDAGIPSKELVLYEKR